ncbi:MAG: ClpXP protease specificity-enhancing factor [Methylophilaceae bacterium]|nr:ClpXP protease specificity-enhancing factor [Methylophilales bacterium]
MTTLTSTKPYLVRAIHEWCMDNNLTPHLLVAVDAKTRVPMAYVKDGEIVLNLSYSATKDLHLDNEAVVFSARFGGISQNLYIPMHAVRGIFARENSQGMFFEIDSDSTDLELNFPDENTTETTSDKPLEASDKVKSKKPTLTIVK